ncbi:MAG: hypothetical protein LUH40_05335 [Clostridiales bacterium]|nr:hypothetical protein [Clostridiales bacterium]
MSGIDKIIAHLSSDCEQECAEIAKKAEDKAAEIIADAQQKAEIKSNEIVTQAQKKADEIIRLAQSSAQMQKRQNELASKVRVLNSVLKDALVSIENMSDNEYWSALESLAVRNAQKGSGQLLVSQKEMKSVPENFISTINSRISDKGSLELASSDKIDKKGMVLVYGDIEINLTFEAIIDASRDELKETAQKVLFD